MLFFKIIVYIEILTVFCEECCALSDLFILYLYLTNCWASSPTSVQRKAVGNIPMKN